MSLQCQLLLTGGTGFFGRSLLRYWRSLEALRQNVPQVTVMTRSIENFERDYPEFCNQSWLQLHHGDVCIPKSYPRGIPFTHVLHAATDSTRGPALAPLERFDQIVVGVRNALDFAIECKARRFLYTSSGAVYGMQPPEVDQLYEDRLTMPDPLSSSNAYGVAKRTAEHLCTLYGDAYGLQIVNARCFAFLGQDLPLDVHFAIGNFVRDALWKDAITVHGDGTALRSYLDQSDLAHWLVALLDNGVAGQAYNVGSDEAISVSALAHLVRDVLAPGKPVQILGRGHETQARSVYVPNIQKVKREFGLSVTVPLRSAIQDMARGVIAAREGTTHPHES